MSASVSLAPDEQRTLALESIYQLLDQPTVPEVVSVLNRLVPLSENGALAEFPPLIRLVLWQWTRQAPRSIRDAAGDVLLKCPVLPRPALRALDRRMCVSGAVARRREVAAHPVADLALWLDMRERTKDDEPLAELLRQRIDSWNQRFSSVDDGRVVLKKTPILTDDEADEHNEAMFDLVDRGFMELTDLPEHCNGSEIVAGGSARFASAETVNDDHFVVWCIPRRDGETFMLSWRETDGDVVSSSGPFDSLEQCFEEASRSHPYVKTWVQ